jgi:ABC-2 type transport system permease protein
MIADIMTVVWKESRSLLRVPGSRTRIIITLVTPAVMAVYLPWSVGPDWVNNVIPLLLAIIFPIILVGLTIPDSFAGERERHTLSTLLASRLPDRAILFGKMLTSIIVGWGFGLAMLLLALIVVNIVHWQGHVLFYSPMVAVSSVIVSLLLAVVTAAAGALISLRVAGAQEASQLLMGVILIPFMLLGVGLTIFAGEGLFKAVEAIDPLVALLVFVGVMLLIIAGLMVMVLSRFKRSRLILTG